MNERFCNMPRFKNSSTSFWEKDCLEENILTLDKSSQLALNTADFQLHQRYKIAIFCPINQKAQYGRS